MKAGELEGYWEWFRKDGTKMRSGYFENGKQVGEWTTYDGKGKIVKVTKMKSPRCSSPPIIAGQAAEGGMQRKARARALLFALRIPKQDPTAFFG